MTIPPFVEFNNTMVRIFPIFACLTLVSTSMFAVNQLEFFESRIRPVLAENCYECHNSLGKAKSGLKLDYKQGLLQGGERGPAIS